MKVNIIIGEKYCSNPAQALLKSTFKFPMPYYGNSIKNTIRVLLTSIIMKLILYPIMIS